MISCNKGPLSVEWIAKLPALWFSMKGLNFFQTGAEDKVGRALNEIELDVLLF